MSNEVAFQSWWRASKYCQVVLPASGWEQIARDGFFAALSLGHPIQGEAVTGDAKAWWCEHGDGSIEVVMWPDARDKYASLGYAITPLFAPMETFQERVAAAHVALFHDDPTDIAERRDRFYEEATEAAQSLGMSEDDAHKMVAYTFSRPPGEPEKEIGAAALTLASLCVVGGWDMMTCAEADLAALQTPEKIAKVRAKRATRHGRGPLPGLSASPQPPTPAWVREITEEGWKGMASHSAMAAAIAAEDRRQLIEDGRRLLDMLPAHWHDEATTNFRDLVGSIEERLAAAAAKGAGE